MEEPLLCKTIDFEAGTQCHPFGNKGDVPSQSSSTALSWIEGCREVDTSDPAKACENCGNDGAFRFWLKRYLCNTCKDLLKFRTICRTQAMREYGLTYDEIISGEQDNRLTVFHTPNPHVKLYKDGKPTAYMHLYFLLEIQAYAALMRSTSTLKS